jgi:hypothetical protein
MKKFLLILFCFSSVSSTYLLAQIIVFQDNFNRASLTTGSPTTYSTNITAGDGGASIFGSLFLELTNDATIALNANGRVYVTGLISSFTAPYNTTLNLNPGLITWTFNFRYNRTTNPSGFDLGNYGLAVILCSDVADLTIANGYALVYGQTGTIDPIKLVSFANGLDGNANLTDIISSGINDISAVNNYVSARITFNPTTGGWSLFLRDDGSSSWSDPSSGVSTQIGSTVINNTYTSSTLSNFGFWWGYSTAANQTSQFDNLNVSITINPVTNIQVNGTGTGTGAVSWTSPNIYNNSLNELIVFLKDGSSITVGTPTSNISSYTANPIFGSGSTYENDPNAYCIYTGDGTSINISGIIDGNTYHTLIFNTNSQSSYSSAATGNGILPVELSSFSAIVLDNAVRINWRTETEVNNYGFEIIRSAQNDVWDKIGLVQGYGNSNSPKNYSFIDESITGGKYFYKLKQIDTDGSFEYSKVIEVDLGSPTKFELSQNYPNPFNPSTTIKFAVTETQSTKLIVYDVLGNKVAVLFNGMAEGGKLYEAVFDIENFTSEISTRGGYSSGVYFYRLEAGDKVENKKMLLLK